MGGDKRILVEPTNIENWYEENKELFSPPICNKLLHKGQMTVMFVGGPNTRTDFHLDQGSEFFWMLKGGMELPTIQQGKRKLVKINEGEVFLLPPRIPHSPQRPQEGSLGLVVERERNEKNNEVDGLRWYKDFNTCDEILWERYFYCGDLGRDLVPVVKAYKDSEEFKTGISGANICEHPPFEQNTADIVPAPFNLKEWIESNRTELSQGKTLPLFSKSHPCPEMNILIQGCGVKSNYSATRDGIETMIYQLEGESEVIIEGENSREAKEGTCMVVAGGCSFTAKTASNGLVLLVQQDPKGKRAA